MKVREIMTGSVECIPPDTTISKAAEKMRDMDIGFLPICENDRLVGAVTDRDITIRSVAQGRDPRLAPVKDIMSLQAVYCYEDDEVQNVARKMQDREVRRMLILDHQKKLVGIVSIGDIARASGDQKLVGETLGHIAEAA